ncbi:MAG: hypothetical protein KA146_09325 [Leptospiraceae bacterium]|nr:hypothetical protein [Leptospiraceae bacterium]
MKGIKLLQQKISDGLMSFLQDITKGFRIGIGIVLALTTAGIFAVAVTGTFNTFTSGSVLKAADINANFASLKAAIEGIPTQKAMRLIYENDITSATTSVNITGLDGNIDVEYEIKVRMVSGSAAGTIDYYFQPNSDSNTGNYRERNIYADNATAPTASAANTNPGLYICGGYNASGAICHGKTLLYAKSGFMRSSLNQSIVFISNASWSSWNRHSIWTDTGNNITSLNMTSSQTNGIGAGSRIEVWARR